MKGTKRRAPKARRSSPVQRGRVHPTPAAAAFRYRGFDCVVRLAEDGTWQWHAFKEQTYMPRATASRTATSGRRSPPSSS